MRPHSAAPRDAAATLRRAEGRLREKQRTPHFSVADFRATTQRLGRSDSADVRWQQRGRTLSTARRVALHATPRHRNTGEEGNSHACFRLQAGGVTGAGRRGGGHKTAGEGCNRCDRGAKSWGERAKERGRGSGFETRGSEGCAGRQGQHVARRCTIGTFPCSATTL